LAPSTEFLLLGGVAEGIGATLISVVAPAAISRWFKLEDRGLPMGIWAGWVPVGNVIMFNLAHPLAGALGWRAVWWFGALFSFIALILFILVMTTPPEKKTGAPVEPPPAQAFRRGLLNPTAWLLGLGFGTFGFCLLGYNSWAPTFLTETLRIDPAAASSYASLMFLAAIPANIVAGWMINRLRNRQYVLPVTFLVMGILLFWSFRLSSSVVVMPYMIALGFISNFIPATSFTLAPETAPDAASANMALAIMNVGSNAGALAGPPAIGAIVSGGNWSAGSTGLVIVATAGTMLSWIIARKLEENDGSH
jgi:nitrate/nitrite transporter NarK